MPFTVVTLVTRADSPSRLVARGGLSDYRCARLRVLLGHSSRLPFGQVSLHTTGVEAECRHCSRSRPLGGACRRRAVPDWTSWAPCIERAGRASPHGGPSFAAATFPHPSPPVPCRLSLSLSASHSFSVASLGYQA